MKRRHRKICGAVWAGDSGFIIEAEHNTRFDWHRMDGAEIDGWRVTTVVYTPRDKRNRLCAFQAQKTIGPISYDQEVRVYDVGPGTDGVLDGIADCLRRDPGLPLLTHAPVYWDA